MSIVFRLYAVECMSCFKETDVNITLMELTEHLADASQTYYHCRKCGHTVAVHYGLRQEEDHETLRSIGQTKSDAVGGTD